MKALKLRTFILWSTLWVLLGVYSYAQTSQGAKGGLSESDIKDMIFERDLQIKSQTKYIQELQSEIEKCPKPEPPKSPAK